MSSRTGMTHISPFSPAGHGLTKVGSRRDADSKRQLGGGESFTWGELFIGRLKHYKDHIGTLIIHPDLVISHLWTDWAECRRCTPVPRLEDLAAVSCCPLSSGSLPRRPNRIRHSRSSPSITMNADVGKIISDKWYAHMPYRPVSLFSPSVGSTYTLGRMLGDTDVIYRLLTTNIIQ